MSPHRLARLHSLRAILALLVLGPVWMGCTPTPIETGESRSATVSVTTGSLASSSHQQGIASPVAEAVLTAISEGGTSTLRATLGSRDRMATFEVTVPEGPVTFHAEVVSNTGVTLYDGTDEVMVDSDGFQVEIDLTARAPILLAIPDSLRTTLDGTAPGAGIFLLSNAGRERVQWHLASVSPPQHSCPTDPCLDIFPQSGEIASPTQATHFIRVAPLNTPARLYTLRLETDQGIVELQVDAAAAGAIEARVVEFTGGPPVSGTLVRLRACASGTAGTPGTCERDPSVPDAFAATGSGGTARFSGLRSGLWEVQSNPTGQSMTPNRRTVSLTPGGFVSTLFEAH